MKRVIIAALMLALAARAQDAAPWWNALAGDALAPSETTDFGAWFHVDANRMDSLVLTGDFVEQWRDWRNTGVFASTNAPYNLNLPYILTNALANKKVVSFNPYVAFGQPEVPCLKWSESQSNIMAVFCVFSKNENADYTPLIGDDVYTDFHGGAGGALFVTAFATSTGIANGTVRLDGTIIAADAVDVGIDTFHIVTVLPASPIRGGNFARDRSVQRGGGQKMAEMLIFTNAVLASTVSNIESYLSEKWGIEIAD